MSKQKQLPSSLYRQLKEENIRLIERNRELETLAGGAEVASLKRGLRDRDASLAAANNQIKALLAEHAERDDVDEGQRQLLEKLRWDKVRLNDSLAWARAGAYTGFSLALAEAVVLGLLVLL